MYWQKKYQFGFNRYPRRLPRVVLRPESYAGLRATEAASIMRGLGGSYGDAALNQDGEVILSERLDRFLEFDRAKGILRVEVGVSLSKILEVITVDGWFLPVTPGTAKVSLGGCIAADVHGKNHPCSGSLGNYILGLELITAEGTQVYCSPEVYSDLFWATIGGMGLTGIIGVATLQLKRIETAYMRVEHQVTKDLESTLECLVQNSEENEYRVVWLDGFSKMFCRGIIIKARHASCSELSTYLQKRSFQLVKCKSYKVPLFSPVNLLRAPFIYLFNRAYHYYLARKAEPFFITYQDYFYPLDRIVGWPLLYGSRGFIQYQCVLPIKFAYSTIKRLIETLRNFRQPIYLAVLKYFGPENLSYLSFPFSGFTLALDLPIGSTEIFTCLEKLDELVIEAGGRVYLAKDARLRPETFRAMYPRYFEWLTIKHRWDPKNRFSSSLSRRLEIGFNPDT